MRNATASRAGRAVLSFRDLGLELAVPHPEPLQLGCHRLAERRAGGVSRLRQPVGQLGRPTLRFRERLVRGGERVDPRLVRIELRARGLGAGQKLLVAGGAEAAAGVRDPFELTLDLLEPARLGLERGEEAAKSRGDVLQPLLDVSEIHVLGLELGREVRDRHERIRRLGEPVERAGVSVLGGERLRGRGHCLGELRHVPEALALRTQRVFGVRREAFRPRDQLPQLFEPLGAAHLCARELVAMLARSPELPPGAGVFRAQPEVLLANEGVESVELEGRTRQSPLLELARHGEQPLDERCELLARHRPAPGVRPRAPVREDAPCGDESVIVLGPKFGERREALVVEDALGKVEVRLDVGLARTRPEVARVPGRAEEEPDRLGEDRLACARLPCDRVQARPEARGRPRG